MAVEPKRRLFTVDEYHQMAEAGILGEDDRVELIEGEIVEMSPIGRLHAAAVIRITELLVLAFAGAALTSPQNPVRIGKYSEPQPDLALLRPRRDRYASRIPVPKDVLLIVEVMVTSAEYDRRVKVPLYARSGIREVWLVDLEHNLVTAYTNPSPDGYHTATIARKGDELTPSAFPDHPSAVSDILG